MEGKYQILEFFSGIGGWRSAMSQICHNYEIIMAFDINPIANLVYSSVYQCTPSNKSIENLSPQYLDSLNANVWLMSPPCQPFTRNNATDSRDMNDPRAKAFTHLIEILPKLLHPPNYIALENVVGFENSHCCREFLKVLSDVGYEYRQFILSPTQFGIPNSRPRYYLIASRSRDACNSIESSEIFQGLNGATIYTNLPNQSESEPVILAGYLDTLEDFSQYLVPDSILSKSSSWCFDIATPESSHTACFTKGYGRYIKGTGSILQFLPGALPPHNQTPVDEEQPEIKRQRLSESDDHAESNEKKGGLHTLQSLTGKLRYFTPEELLKLFGFDISHGSFFPMNDQLTLRKKYELIGNSLNVTVAGRLLEFLLSPHRE